MERKDDPRNRRSYRTTAGQTAQSLIAVLLLSTASGCATYDFDRSRPQAAKTTSHVSRPANYVVESGDTISSIARAHGMSREALVDANNLFDPDNLLPGQRIYVPHAGGKKRLLARVTPVRTVYMEPLKPMRRSVVVERDLDEAAEGLDPRIEGARYYSFNGPRAKPNALNGRANAPVEENPERVSNEADDVDLNAAYVPRQHDRKSAQPAKFGGQFIWPVRGKILSSFGRHNGGLHNDGINIAAEPGDSVKAADSGIVVYSGNELASYGNLLLIRHGSGYVTAYAHNRRLLVSKGDKVKRGQAIAHVGATGDVDRPQLHFEIRRGEIAVDPKRYLTTATASR